MPGATTIRPSPDRSCASPFRCSRPHALQFPAKSSPPSNSPKSASRAFISASGERKLPMPTRTVRATRFSGGRYPRLPFTRRDTHPRQFLWGPYRQKLPASLALSCLRRPDPRALLRPFSLPARSAGWTNSMPPAARTRSLRRPSEPVRLRGWTRSSAMPACERPRPNGKFSARAESTRSQAVPRC